MENHRGPAPDGKFPLSLRITQLNVISFQTIDIDIAVAKNGVMELPRVPFQEF